MAICSHRPAPWSAHTNLRAEEDPRICLLVIFGVTAEGKKELVSVSDDLRESKTSWLEILRDMQAHTLEGAPLLAIGDGAMSFLAELDDEPTTSNPLTASLGP